MGFSKELYWQSMRFLYKAKYLKWDWAFKENGAKYQQFKYRTGLQEQILKWVIRLNRRQGFNLDYVIEKWHKKAGILKVDAIKILSKDTRSLHVWELEHLLKAMDMDIIFKENEIHIKWKGERKYSCSVEKGRLIIVANQNPFFVINMDANNFYDFTVDFYKVDKFLKITEFKVLRFVMEALRYYFFDQAELEKLPFNEKKMRDLIKEKYHRNEMSLKK